MWEWREQYGGTIIEQLKRLGASCDYDEERFTLDEAYAEAVLHVFGALYRKGYIYRDRYMVNWDPGSRSAISDLEVEAREETDTLYYIDYPLASGSGAITVATVRPETMLADIAIAVHPEDERYRRLIGEKAILPLVGRKLKIIADDYVKPEFGTGALKITPGSDPNDFEIAQRHGLPVISVIGEDGRITDEAPERFVGMTIAEAQEAVVAELREQGLIARTEPYTHTVPYSHRSGERIEPLVSLQWFMRMDELAQPAIEAVRDGRVRIHPDSQRRRYLDWMENIRPWCISRQLWWGHQIPVWYRGDETYVGTEAPGGDGWERDPDVLDTWFSSALWPFATLGWPEDTAQLRAFYPTDVLSTARDIIFLWVARMVMMGLEFTEREPFSDVYVHSIIQAPDGRRMSKSLGTGIDPMDLINGGPRPPVFEAGGEFPAYGADAVRWGLLAMSSGQDVRFSEDKVAQGQQLTNKLWNASRLILLGVGRGRARGRAPERDRGSLDPVAARARAVRVRRADRRVRLLARGARALRLRLRRAVRLVSRARQAAAARRRSGAGRDAALRAHRDARTRPPDHPVRHRGDLLVRPRGVGAARRRVSSDDGGTTGAMRTPRPSSPRLIEAVQAIRAWRDSAGVRAGAVVPARLAADGYAQTAEQLARLARLSVSANGAGEGGASITAVPVPGGTVEILPSEDVDLDAAQRKREARAHRARCRDRALRAQARQRGIRRPRRGRRSSQAERDKLERLRRELRGALT